MVVNNMALLSGQGYSTGVGFDSIDRRLSWLGQDGITHGSQGEEYVVTVPKFRDEL
jgi:hypothetical protein